MKLNKNAVAGLKPRNCNHKDVIDILMIEHFYYCAIIALRLRMKSEYHDNSVSHIEINLYLLKWLDIALKKKLWGKPVKNEILWLRSAILKNPLSDSTTSILFNIYTNLQTISSKMK